MGELRQVLRNDSLDIGAKGNLQPPGRGIYYREAIGNGGLLNCAAGSYVDRGRAKVGGGRNPLKSLSVDGKKGGEYAGPNIRVPL